IKMKVTCFIGVILFAANVFVASSVDHSHSGPFHNFLDRLKFSKSHGYSKQEVDKDDKGLLICATCNTAVNLFVYSMENNATEGEIIDGIVGICLGMNLFSETLCRGLVEEAIPDFIYMYENGRFDSENACGLALQGFSCKTGDITKLEWSLPPPGTQKPPMEVSPPREPDAPTLKVLHVSDFHWDPEYLPGSNADCGDPLCCRAGSGIPANESAIAGYWGDYRDCDLPLWTLRNSMEHIASTHSDIDFIVWTGDLPPHDIWETDATEHLNIIQEMTNLLLEFFPNIPVYGAIGNHESHPVNAYPIPEIEGENSISWLYNSIADAWSVWLPEDALTTLRYGGYYSTLVREGLRVISANFNYCYTYNWWIIHESRDPANGLQFIQSELEKAEAAGEKVYIISHIVPGKGDCWQIYTRELNKVVNRFEDTLAGQFYGHTHSDEFKIFYDTEDPSRAINVAWIGPSLTSYVDINPGYKVYLLDGEREGSTFGMLEHEAWIMNLTEANIGPSEPNWFKLYDGRETFGLNSLSAQDMSNLVDRFIIDEELFQTYYRNYVKQGDPAMLEGCDIECKQDLLCSMVTSNFGDQTKCNEISRKMTLDD
ncbi:hypothetical protein QYM36_018450, partial [Artemia franciscana]